jgi:hypothetical protein
VDEEIERINDFLLPRDAISFFQEMDEPFDLFFELP